MWYFAAIYEDFKKISRVDFLKVGAESAAGKYIIFRIRRPFFKKK